ncbi:MAG: T9SS type A sorting domain-containing protein [Ignavibacteria bacterium]|nr:T9SS type A sorting domain-containing protein [Ignavibacteria bacterium]
MDIIGGGLNTLYKTTNGGINFYRQKTDSSSFAFISSISFIDGLTGWYCCAVGRIYKTTTGGQWITNIELNSAEVPEAFELQQNYPNPFNNSTEIGFSIKNHGHYRLEVFDVLGQYADIIFDRVILPGVNSVSYEASNLSSGVYFYRLYSNELHKARKFVVTK